MENLGKKGKDKITGFSGIITARCDYLYGCVQYGVTPPLDKDGKKQSTEWFDEGRIEITGKGIDSDSVQADEPGCDNQDHPKSN